MDIHHLHFYVDDADRWRNWFEHYLGGQPLGRWLQPKTHSELLQLGRLKLILSAPRTADSPVAHFLAHHGPGVADVALAVTNIDQAWQTAIAAGARVTHPLHTAPQGQRWGQVRAWGSLHHTLMQAGPEGQAEPVPGNWQSCPSAPAPTAINFRGVDHAVLNLPTADFLTAIDWYQQVLGFEPQQSFSIATPRSSLDSQVMIHPQGTAQIPLNHPTSENSQIQEFLHHNGGAGIQHIALSTPDIVAAVAQARQRGLAFLSVPPTYYQTLKTRPGFNPTAADWQAISQQQILVDWETSTPTGLLLQTFTEPFLGRPTFFWELIERRPYWLNGQWQLAAGFGAGNFQALFEAIERQQQQRGSL